MKFRKKPVVIEAVQWNPDQRGSQIGGWPESHKTVSGFDVSCLALILLIPTLEGEMKAFPGDWVIKGVKGEFYSCKPDIFEATYEPVDQAQ